MKQAGGGFAPSYNVQIDTDAANGVVVAVGVVQAGNDFEQLESGIERVEQNLGKTPQSGGHRWWVCQPGQYSGDEGAGYRVHRALCG